MTRPTALAAFAAQHHHVISTAQLKSLGLTRDAIAHLVRTERIFRVHRGVYAVGREQLTKEARWAAAVLAGPAGCALGLVSAAVSWQLLEFDSALPQVIAFSASSNRGVAGIDLHRSSTLIEADLESRNGIRTTKILRTLSDLSRAGLEDRLLSAAVRQAGRLHRVDLQRLADTPRLGRIVSLYDPLLALTESDLEAIFVALCVKYRLPLPDAQTRFGRRRADFTWPRFGLVVECDGAAWHANAVNHRDDRAKERALRAAGYEVLRFTWAEAVHAPFAVAQEIRAAMRRRAHLSAPSPV